MLKTQYRHCCAVCRSPFQEMHHIDEDPSNNEPNNLIPLCSNCHHGRVHGHGFKLDAKSLRLYKDLGSRFAATGAYGLLLKRASYLTTGTFELMEWELLCQHYEDFVSFVTDLKHGRSFLQKMARTICPPRKPGRVYCTVVGPDTNDRDDDLAKQEAAHDKEFEQVVDQYRDHLRAAQSQVAALLDEILMAQDP